MINLLIAYDDNCTTRLGDYFDDSYNYIATEVRMKPWVKLTSIRGLECNEENINQCIDSYLGNRFIFVGLSHGDTDRLSTSNASYVTLENSTHFLNSLFYTNACSTAIVLGKSLIENGTLVYIGYDSNVGIEGDLHNHVFIQCENYALFVFINSQKTIGDSYNDMIDFYNKEIDRLVEEGYTLVASCLADNRASLVILGNKDLTVNDFQV